MTLISLVILFLFCGIFGIIDTYKHIKRGKKDE